MKQFKILSIIVLLSIILSASEDIPTKEEVAKLYVATFNRAPDSVGLDYWTNDSNLKLSQIAQSFFDQTETKALYPDGTSNRDFIVSVYSNLFNRVPDSSGWDYWEEQLDKRIFSKNSFIEAVINGAQDNDKVILSNKTEVGLSFASNSLNNVEEARSIINGITYEATTVNSALSHIQSIIDSSLDPAKCKQIDITDITTDTIWNDKCYTINKDIRVYDGALLTISAGTTLFFQEGISLRIDSALKAVGSTKDRILFTGVQKSIGYWDGLYLSHANNSRNEIAYSTIEYAGGGYYNGSLYVDGDSLLNIHDSVIQNGKEYGFNILGDVTILNFKNITSTKNDTAGRIYSNNLSKIDSSSNFTGNLNDYLAVDGQDMTTDQTWTPLSVPVYFLESDIRVYDGALLTIKPNSLFLCNPTFTLRIDSALEAIGTATEPIIFKGKESINGYWEGIYIYEANDNRNKISYMNISNAGGGFYNGAIYIDGISLANIENSTITNSKGYGIYVGRDATLTESGNSFGDNLLEDLFYKK